MDRWDPDCRGCMLCVFFSAFTSVPSVRIENWSCWFLPLLKFWLEKRRELWWSWKLKEGVSVGAQWR